MTVYLLWYVESYDSADVVGVYASRELALASVAHMNKKFVEEHYHIEEKIVQGA